MAIVYTQRANTVGSRNLKVWDVACLAADTGPTNQAHLFGMTPMVWFEKHVTAAAAPEWCLTADGTNITLTKQGSAGSGGAAPGVTVVVTVFAMRPSSLIK